MIPTKTGAASAVGLVLPELNGKLDGYAIRVPTINVSIVDLSFIASRDTTVDEVNAIMKEASEGALKGILGYNTGAAGVGRFQPQPGFVDVRRDADQGVGPPGEGIVLVRQRVGFLEPYAGHGCGSRQREVSCTAAPRALHMKNRSPVRFFFACGFTRTFKVAKPYALDLRPSAPESTRLRAVRHW